jgi:hypothetical protein
LRKRRSVTASPALSVPTKPSNARGIETIRVRLGYEVKMSINLMQRSSDKRQFASGLFWWLTVAVGEQRDQWLFSALAEAELPLLIDYWREWRPDVLRWIAAILIFALFAWFIADYFDFFDPCLNNASCVTG